MDINYELYKVFFHVASTLSFSEASKQLFISSLQYTYHQNTGAQTGSGTFYPQY